MTIRNSGRPVTINEPAAADFLRRAWPRITITPKSAAADVQPRAALRAQLAQWRRATRELFVLAANDAALLAELTAEDREDILSGAACLATAMRCWEENHAASVQRGGAA
ncbi:MAG: hypothetical protein RL722_2279 [Pseudomonadota bacterium]|jgi:hypothetical protein